MNIKNILIPVDFTDTSSIAVSEAIKLAIPLNADCFLLHVIEYHRYDYSMVSETQTMLIPLEDHFTAMEKKMRLLKESIESKHELKVNSLVTTGDIHSQIIGFTKLNKIDLIVMGTHGASGYRELFIGSNAQKVVTLSQVPVLTLQEGFNKLGFQNILIPIDNSTHSREKVDLAILMAKIYNSKIHILGLPDSEEEIELNKFKIKLKSVEEIISDDSLAFETRIIHVENIAKSALDFASEKNCDLIVINTGHESKITGIFLGVFAQQIVNHSKIPVLSFKHSQDHFSIETPGFGI